MPFNPDQAFQLANGMALAGWVSLLASPLIPRWSERIAGIAIPLLLGAGYAAIVLVFWSRGEGGFDTLDNVAALFRSRELLLAGWIHYLAFDLFIGAWQVRTGANEAIPFVLVIPCLVLTFLFGPVGLLLFFAIRSARGRRTSTPNEGLVS
ncbi:MAG: DUF4281 domain-containing protein [Nitratireductor sp.]|nr:DUF4281 domain-containing protein [Nitratireductor sp.]